MTDNFTTKELIYALCGDPSENPPLIYKRTPMPTSPSSVTTSAALPNTTAINYGGKVKKPKKKAKKK